jgi:hypothetical protein
MSLRTVLPAWNSYVSGALDVQASEANLRGSLEALHEKRHQELAQLEKNAQEQRGTAQRVTRDAAEIAQRAREIAQGMGISPPPVLPAVPGKSVQQLESDIAGLRQQLAGQAQAAKDARIYAEFEAITAGSPKQKVFITIALGAGGATAIAVTNLLIDVLTTGG